MNAVAVFLLAVEEGMFLGTNGWYVRILCVSIHINIEFRFLYFDLPAVVSFPNCRAH